MRRAIRLAGVLAVVLTACGGPGGSDDVVDTAGGESSETDEEQRPSDLESTMVDEILGGGELAPPYDEPQFVGADALGSSACGVLVADEPLLERKHYEPDEAPPAAALYDMALPHSGSHFSQTFHVGKPGQSWLDAEPDVRAVTHNLEHGSVVFWLGTDLSEEDVAAADETARRLAASGFHAARAGAAVTAFRTADTPGVALRAWGQAIDCPSWDRAAALGFVIEHYGSHGTAPEGDFAPYPAGVLAYEGEG